MTSIDLSIRYLPDVRCPACSCMGAESFYDLKGVPIDGATVFNDQQSARNSACGDISLCLCENCGYIFNKVFDESVFNNQGSYQDQQGYSPAFQKYAEQLSNDLIAKYHLNEKVIVEIGCGKGDFLKLLVEKGNNTGIGIDPKSTHAGPSKDNIRLRFLKEHYAAAHKRLMPDFICCRHTLEHVNNPLEFIRTLRRAITSNHSPDIFFELPDMTRILDEAAFWDIYYEHCGYYCPESLRGLFLRCGFLVSSVNSTYHKQHLVLHAAPGPASQMENIDDSARSRTIRDLVLRFNRQIEKKAFFWNNLTADAADNQKRIVIWGSGSKCVGFFSLLNAAAHIEYIVDINPHRHGTYLPRFAKKIVAPSFLTQYKPDIVIIMNPVYEEEISFSLNDMRLNPKIYCL